MFLQKRGFLFFFIIVLVAPVAAEIFQFKYQKGIKYKIETTVEAELYINGIWDQKSESVNKISVEITDVDNDAGFLSATFQTLEKASQENTVYKLVDEVHNVTYRVDARGKYSSAKNQLFPQTRDVPLFPEESIEIGHYWEAAGREIFDLEYMGLREPVIVPLDVNYVYIKNETIDGVECAVFLIYYSFVLNMEKNAGSDGIYPYKIVGQTDTRYFFDIANGRPYYYEDTIDQIFIFTNGDIMEFRGKSKGQVTEGDELKREEMVAEIQKIIAEEGIKDTAVSQEDDGVKITLEDINFPPDSFLLVDTEKAKLSQLAKILNKYPGKALLISGHTALAGTARGRKVLSEQRARAVGEYLLSLGVSSSQNMIFEGYGAEKPVADNSTAAGMKKNRRVEIKILEN